VEDDERRGDFLGGGDGSDFGWRFGGRTCCDRSEFVGRGDRSEFTGKENAIEASFLEEAIEATLLEDENTQIENENAGLLVAKYIQKHADDYHGVFNPPHDGDCLIAVANDGVNERDRISRGLIVKAASYSMRSDGADAETIAAYERNMSRPGTVMTGAEIQAVADCKRSVVMVTSVVCITKSSDFGETLNAVVFYPKDDVNSQGKLPTLHLLQEIRSATASHLLKALPRAPMVAVGVKATLR
jgi:hypothetical protein